MYVSFICIYKEECLSVRYAFSLCNSLRYQAFYATFLCPEEDQEGFTIIARSSKEISVSSLENRMIFSSILLSVDYIFWRISAHAAKLYVAHLFVQKKVEPRLSEVNGRSRREFAPTLETIWNIQRYMCVKRNVDPIPAVKIVIRNRKLRRLILMRKSKSLIRSELTKPIFIATRQKSRLG